MRKMSWAILAAVVVLLASPLSGYAGRKHVYVGAHVRVGHPACRAYHRPWRHHVPSSRLWVRGTVIWGPWFSCGYCAPPRVVIQQEPPVYVQPEEEPYYWYYCQDPQGYYPYVRNCPGGWMKVVPDVKPPQE